MSERKESSVLFSLNELAAIETDRVKRESEEKKRQDEENQRRKEEEARLRREQEVRAKADAEANKARTAAESKAREERERLEVELAAQRAREEVERNAAIERARLEAQKRGKPFDPNAVFNQQPQKSNAGIIGGVSALAAVLIGGLVYATALRDDGVTLVIPSPAVTINKTTVVEKVKEVQVAPTPTPAGTPTKSGGKKTNTGGNPDANTGGKKCPKNDPLCGLKF